MSEEPKLLVETWGSQDYDFFRIDGDDGSTYMLKIKITDKDSAIKLRGLEVYQDYVSSKFRENHVDLMNRDFEFQEIMSNEFY